MKSVLRTLFVYGLNVLWIAGFVLEGTDCLANASAKVSISGGDVAGQVLASAIPGKYQTALSSYSFGSGKIIRPQIVNEPPVIGLNPVTFERQRNSTWKIKISDLFSIAEVWDPDGNLVTLTAVSCPTTNGGIVVVSGAFIYYTPPATNGNVTDSFTYTVSDEFYDTTEGMVVLTVPASPPAGQPISIEPTNGVVHLRFSGIPGQLYLIQRATNMIEPVHWVTLTNIVADRYGRFEYTDTTPPPSAAFYRAVAP